MEPTHAGRVHQREKGKQFICQSFLVLVSHWSQLAPQGINWATFLSCNIWPLQSASKEA